MATAEEWNAIISEVRGFERVMYVPFSTNLKHTTPFGQSFLQYSREDPTNLWGVFQMFHQITDQSESVTVKA